MKRFFNSPAFIILIMLVILNFVRGGFSDPMEWLMGELVMLPGIIIGLSFHEFAHGIVSYALGDPTPKLQGRLTINPAAHIDPFGFIALLLAGFGWGVAGVAWATIIAQAISAVLCLIKLFRMHDILVIKWKTLRPKKVLLGQLVRLGLPSGLTQAIFSLAMIIVQSLTNSFGTAVIAANTVVMRVDGFAMMPNFTFGTAMTTFAGQNIGAGRLDRVEKGTKDGMKLGVSVSVVLVGLILLFGRYLMQLFTKTPEVIALGTRMLFILAVGYVAMAVTQIFSGVMRGAGDTMTPMWISIITTVIIRMPIAYGLEALTRPAGGAMGSGAPDCLFISLLISWVLGAVLTGFAYRMGKWKKKSIVKRD